MIVSLLTGFLTGLVATALTNREDRMGCIGNILVGWLGSWLGQTLFGSWGPQLWGVPFVPAILGSCILLVLFVKRNDFRG